MIKKILLMASVSFLGLSLSDASITSMTSWTYGTGIYCDANLDVADQTVTLSGTQWTGSGTMGTTLTASSTTDPILTIDNSINNTSAYAWTEYIVTVTMNQSFSISSASVTVPGDWSASITTPTLVSPENYAGVIDYLAGTPVAANTGLLDFGYVLSFSGLQSYSLTESVNAVPEPRLLSLVMAGALLVGGWVMANRRQVKAIVRA